MVCCMKLVSVATLGCISKSELWSQVPSLPIEFNETYDHSWPAMLSGIAPRTASVAGAIRTVLPGWILKTSTGSRTGTGLCNGQILWVSVTAGTGSVLKMITSSVAGVNSGLT